MPIRKGNLPVNGQFGTTQKSSAKRSPILWLLAAQAVLVVAAIALWLVSRADAVASPPEPRPQPPAEALRPATLESAYPFALARARQWDDDAELLAAMTHIDWPLDGGAVVDRQVPGGGWLNYTFVAPSDAPLGRRGTAVLRIRIERYGGTIADELTTGWEQETPPLGVDLTALAIDSSAAAIVAERVGGDGFREACPLVRHVSRAGLAAGDDGQVAWAITYSDDRHPERAGFSARIDAASGAALEIGGDPQPCDP